MFRDETRKTAQKASTRAQKQKTGKIPLPSNSGSLSESNSSSLISLSSSNTPDEISRSLSVNMNQQAICFFMHNYVLPTTPTSGRVGYMHNLINTSTEAVSSCMAAVGMATLANVNHSADMRIAAREQYAHALSLTNAMLRDPAQARQPTALDTVMLLGMFE
ncbi:hypothetical protein FQN49_007249, partial [Arthroderma sp. PD_2]